MSRCFPYPPPGYTLSRASNEALIESIKLQKEREKAKEKKKEKRREKKERKKEKRKEKKDDPNHKPHKSDTAKSTLGQNCPVTKGELPLKRKEAQIEQLEGDSLTEEHGLPVSSNVLPSTSSDSTNTSNKRKRHYLPSNESHGHGKIISIKLSSKQNSSNSSANVNELRLCSQSGNTCLAPEDSNNKLRYGRENTNSALASDGEQICSTSRQVEGVAKGTSGIPSVPKPVMTSMQREELNYNKLVGNWSPPQLQDSFLDADAGWLFQFRNPAEKRPRHQNDGVSCSSSSALRPRAQLLNGVDMYALPFTVPF